MAKWRKLTAEEQKSHHLYGIKNWLAVFALLIIGRAVLSWQQITAAAHRIGTSLPDLFSTAGPLVEFLRNALILDTAVAGIILYTLFTKAPAFRIASTVALAASIPIAFFLSYLSKSEEVASEMGRQLVPMLMSTLIWCLYLNLSRRVRVTCESSDVDDGNGKTKTQFKAVVGPDLIGQEALYAKHALAYHSEARDIGLYTRLFVELDGNEEATRLAYIKCQVDREFRTRASEKTNQEMQRTVLNQRLQSVAPIKEASDYRKGFWETVGVLLLIFAVGGVALSILSDGTGVNANYDSNTGAPAPDAGGSNALLAAG